jgi:hypothetical protein
VGITFADVISDASQTMFINLHQVFLNFCLYMFSVFEDPIPVCVIHLMRGEKLFGYGWLVFKDNENVYVMTRNSVLRLINSDQVDNALEIRVSYGKGEPAKYDATVTKNDFVVVRSDDNTALDYVVLKLKTSPIVQELPLQVSKESPEPGDKAVITHVYPVELLQFRVRVQRYPEDLVDWLKSSGSSNSSNIPTPSCESSINFDDAEDLKQILIAIYLTPSMPGLPIFKDLDGQVVAMCIVVVVCLSIMERRKNVFLLLVFVCQELSMTFTVRNQVKPRNGSQTILIKAVERSQVYFFELFNKKYNVCKQSTERGSGRNRSEYKF